MGYYTHHSLEIIEQPAQCSVSILYHMGRITELAGYGSLFDGEPCKWYDCEDDMLIYSTDHPDTVFALKGEGEDPGDIWIRYFKDGKGQYCPGKITFDEYDESKLN